MGFKDCIYLNPGYCRRFSSPVSSLSCGNECTEIVSGWSGWDKASVIKIIITSFCKMSADDIIFQFNFAKKHKVNTCDYYSLVYSAGLIVINQLNIDGILSDDDLNELKFVLEFLSSQPLLKPPSESNFEASDIIIPKHEEQIIENQFYDKIINNKNKFDEEAHIISVDELDLYDIYGCSEKYLLDNGFTDDEIESFYKLLYLKEGLFMAIEFDPNFATFFGTSAHGSSNRIKNEYKLTSEEKSVLPDHLIISVPDESKPNVGKTAITMEEFERLISKDEFSADTDPGFDPDAVDKIIESETDINQFSDINTSVDEHPEEPGTTKIFTPISTHGIRVDSSPLSKYDIPLQKNIVDEKNNDNIDNCVLSENDEVRYNSKELAFDNSSEVAVDNNDSFNIVDNSSSCSVDDSSFFDLASVPKILLSRMDYSIVCVSNGEIVNYVSPDFSFCNINDPNNMILIEDLSLARRVISNKLAKLYPDLSFAVVALSTVLTRLSIV